MSNLLEAARQALSAIVDITYGMEKSRIWNGTGWTYNPLSPVIYKPLIDMADAQIETLSHALEEAEKQKTLQEIADNEKDLGIGYGTDIDDGTKNEPVGWIGLTEKERADIRSSVVFSEFGTAWHYASKAQILTEEKLKEKNYDI